MLDADVRAIHMHIPSIGATFLARFTFVVMLVLALQVYGAVASPTGGPLSVSVTPLSASVQASGGAQAFIATVQNDKQNRGVTWSLAKRVLDVPE
jgi:hypothetical protein